MSHQPGWGRERHTAMLFSSTHIGWMFHVSVKSGWNTLTWGTCSKGILFQAGDVIKEEMVQGVLAYDI